jgi:hypothetical protein
MTYRLRRAGIAIAVAFVLVGAFLGWRDHSEDVRVRTVAANTAKAQELKAALARRFTVGTSEAEVLEVLRREHPNFLTFPTSVETAYAVPVGNEPSNVWYCGSTTAYVRVLFRAGQLVRTEIERWSTDCL